MWKIKAGVAVAIAVAGLITFSVTDRYRDRGLHDTGQGMMWVGGLLAAWISFKALAFGIDGDD